MTYEDDDEAAKFLEERGFKDLRNGLFKKPQRDITKEEVEAMQYLYDEWDYDFI